jgi:Tol biopolymer transport system component
MNKLKLTFLFLGFFTGCLFAQDRFPVRQLTDDPAQQGFSTWSPDGEFLVYQYTDLHDTFEKNGLWKISPEGTDAEQIFYGLAEHPAWSPDGRYIVFDADTGRSIQMIPADGGDPIRFLPDIIQIVNGGLPCWSPDGLKIAFKDSDYALCIYNVNTGTTTRIYREEGMILLPGCWSEDGKYILIALMNRQSRKSTIWKISSDGKKKIQITGHHENFYRYLALSPDGSLLIYGAMEGRYIGLYIMPSGGGTSIPLAVTSGGHNEGASWSPDGKTIAFTSTRSGHFDIWLMELDMVQINKKLETGN